jgi:hypothetical protein
MTVREHAVEALAVLAGKPKEEVVGLGGQQGDL